MCTICDGASRDEAMFHLDHLISRRGWAIQGVEASAPGDSPWAYTIGLSSSFGHAELVVIDVDVDVGAPLLQLAAELVRDGERLGPLTDVATEWGSMRFGMVHPAHLDAGLMDTWRLHAASPGQPMPRPEVLQLIPPSGLFCACHRLAVRRLVLPSVDFARRPAAARGDGSAA